MLNSNALKDSMVFYRDYKILRSYLAEVSCTITSSKELEGQPLFYTRKGSISIFDVFIMKLPPEIRFMYDCNSCRKFFDTYGNLAYVNDDGDLKSVMWDESRYIGPFRYAIEACRKVVEASTIYNVFEYDPKEMKYKENLIIIGKQHYQGWGYFFIVLDTDNILVSLKDKSHTRKWFKSMSNKAFVELYGEGNKIW